MIIKRPSILILAPCLSVFGLQGCAPKVSIKTEADVAQGLQKTVEFEVRKRASRELRHEIRFSHQNGTVLTGARRDDTLDTIAFSAAGSERLPSESTLFYQLITYYKWPIFPIRKEIETEGSILVESPVFISSSTDSICLGVGQTRQAYLIFKPVPMFDHLSVSALVTGAPIEHSEASEDGGYELSFTGIDAGETTMTYDVMRSGVAAHTMQITTVGSLETPLGLHARPLGPGDDSTPPPDIDQATDQPVVLEWNAKKGALRYTLQILDADGNRAIGSLLAADKTTYVAWLPRSVSYQARIRAEVDRCSGAAMWTEFSASLPFSID